MGYQEPTIKFDAAVYDAEMRLGLGRVEDLRRVLSRAEDLEPFYSLVCDVIMIRDADPKGYTHLAAGALREWLAVQMVNKGD